MQTIVVQSRLEKSQKWNDEHFLSHILNPFFETKDSPAESMDTKFL